MGMLLTRRTMLASLGVAASLRAANTHVRAGCLITAASFDEMLVSLKEVQALGYTGFTTTMRLLQTRAEDVRAQLSDTGLDLIGLRATLPKSAELGNERALEDLSRIAMAAKQFGARTLMLHSAGLGKFKPEELDAKAKFFDLCARRCKETGVIFIYRTQEAEFQNEAAEVSGLVSKTDKNITYYDFDLARAPEAIAFFRDNPSRTFAMEAPFADSALKVHDLGAAVKHTKWISWLIDAVPGAESRGVLKRVFSI